MSTYALFHELTMRGFAILGGLLVAYLLAVGLNAIYEAIRGGRHS